MASIITDQIRILNAKNFVNEVKSSDNSYYSFIGLPNATDFQSDWNISPTFTRKIVLMKKIIIGTLGIALKKINSSDVRQVVIRRLWNSEQPMICSHRHDYSRSNTAKIFGATNLYIIVLCYKQ